MGRTLEDFFVHGKPHNCLSNRVFVRIDGMLMEQRATDLSEVTSDRFRQPSFHDIVTGKVDRTPFIQRGVPIRLNDKEIGKGDVAEVDGNLQLKIPANVLQTINAFTGAEDDTKFSIRTLQPDHSKIGMMGGIRPSDVFCREREESLTNQNFIANSVASRRLAQRPAQRAQLQLSELAVSGHMFNVGNLSLEAAVVEKWIMQGHQEDMVETARVMEIDRLVKGSAVAASFVCRIINHLFEPQMADDPHTYTYKPATLQQMNHMQLCDVFKRIRPVKLAVTDISRAFKHVVELLPHVKYVCFDNDLKWKFVDRDFNGVQVDGIADEDILETAVLAAADRGILNKWLNPAA